VGEVDTVERGGEELECGKRVANGGKRKGGGDGDGAGGTHMISIKS